MWNASLVASRRPLDPGTCSWFASTSLTSPRPRPRWHSTLLTAGDGSSWTAVILGSTGPSQAEQHAANPNGEGGEWFAVASDPIALRGVRTWSRHLHLMGLGTVSTKP